MSEIINSSNSENGNYDHRWDDLDKDVKTYETRGNVDASEMGEEERKKKETERQERKIISALLTHDADALFTHDVDGFEERYYDEFLEKRKSGEISDEDEAGMLEQIQTPAEKMGAASLAEKMSYDKHMSKILHRFSEDNGSEYQWINGRNVDSFLGQYPTPFAFEEEKDTFLEMIKVNNSERKYQEYVRDMEKFQQTIYGKRCEYYNVLKGLDKKMELANGSNGELSEKVPLPIGELNVDRPDLAIYTCSRAETKGRDPEDSEDSYYESAESGIMAVFDGAGGEANAKEASSAAAEFLKSYDSSYYLENVRHLASAAYKMNKKVLETGGISTGIVAKVREEGDKKMLDFVNVGDSRLYLVRDGRAEQLSHDEGVGHQIFNYLGKEGGFTVADWGEGIELRKGDRLLMCSDGVTGDTENDSLSSEDVARLVGSGATAGEAAKNLVLGAKKKDDRTAIVKIID